MRPLIWKMHRRKTNNKINGFLPLILILLVLYLFRAGLTLSSASGTTCKRPLYVQMEGGVRTPGVYEFCHNPLLQELIQRAGGTRPPSSLSVVADDLPLPSGSKWTIERVGSRWNVMKGEMSSFYKVILQIPVSINRESIEGLEALPGIGPRLAKGIVNERLKRGGFKSLEELIAVPGMGHALYRKIRPFITL